MRRYACWLCLGILLVLAGRACGDGDVAAEVRALTGARTRIVWLADISGTDSWAMGRQLALMGLDTDDGKGVHRILPDVGNYRLPLITPRGNRIVFTLPVDHRCYIMNWDGTGQHALVSGLAIAVWADPTTGLEWVYVQTAGDIDSNRSPARGVTPIFRYQIDHPEVCEPVWTKDLDSGDAAVDIDNVQLSADGTHASGLFPWPRPGIATLPNGPLIVRGSGCWTSLAPDNSYRFWHSDGPHRHLMMYDWGADHPRAVAIDTAPGIEGKSVYFPRWSNHPRFMVMTGPGIGGADADLYLGKFTADFSAIEKWARVTHDQIGDAWPDAWIAGASPAGKTGTPALGGPDSDAAWPPVRDGLVFAWSRRTGQNMVDATEGIRQRHCEVTPQGDARYSLTNGMNLTGGWFTTNLAGKELLAALATSQAFSLEALITPEDTATTEVRQITTIAAPNARNFFLGQHGSRFVIWCRTQYPEGDTALKPCTFGALTAGKPYHVLVTYEPGTLTCYVNGMLALTSNAGSGDLRTWTPGSWYFGDNVPATSGWHGTVEGVALYNRALRPREVRDLAQQAAERVAKRPTPPRAIVLATLLEATAIPAPASIAPYKHGLVAHRYRLAHVENGVCAAKEFIAVYWAIRDRTVLPDSTRTPGVQYYLTLEPYDAHEEIMSENVTMDLSVFDLPMFYEVRPARPVQAAGK